MSQTLNENNYDSAYYLQKESGFESTQRSDHNRIIELMDFDRNGSIMEIGCGFGVLLSKIPAKRKVGIESNIYAVNKCKEKGLEISFVPHEGVQYNYDSGSMDAVIMNEVIEHFKDPEFILTEAFRLLKNGGRIAITTPAKSLLVRNLDETHFSEMSTRQLRRLVEKSGFKILHHEVCGLNLVYFMLRIFVFVPGGIIRRTLLKKSGKAIAVDNIRNSFDSSFLAKALSKFRKTYLWLGTQQLIIAEK